MKSLKVSSFYFLFNRNLDEIEILKFLNHPGIIKFIEKFETKTHLYIINELIDSGDLYEYVKLNSFMSGLAF